MTILTCVEDLRRLAQRRVPRMLFEYVDGASWTGKTCRANMDDLQAIKFRQRVVASITDRTTRSTMVSQEVAMPVALAPAGLTGMQYADGEILAARAAEKFGVPFTLSTMSICSIEDIAASTSKPFWFQLYLMKDRDFVRSLIDRAHAASCSALVLTLDLPVFGQRHKDLLNGMTVPPKWNRKTVADLITHPRWCANILKTQRRGFGNIIGHAREVPDMESLSAWSMQQFQSHQSWSDVEWVRRHWKGKLILKGILDPDDAKAAAHCGADAIVVSNHGGRQLDGAPSSIEVLPVIIDHVGNSMEVHMDGGIRSGQDVLRALALGAQGVYIGRPYLYGLGALGEAGVEACLEIIHKELDLTMALCGISDITQASPALLMP